MIQTKVLVVEDESLVRMAACSYLDMSGFTVVEATTGDEAIEFLSHTQVDIVFTDVRMPGSVDGLALARWVRNYCPNTKVVITSGDVGAKNRGEDLSQHIFIPKPYSLDNLTATFKAAASVAA